MKKIDIHCHCSNRIIKDIIPLGATISHIIDYMKSCEIEKTILLATYFPHKQSGISNFRLLSWIKNYSEYFYFFGSLDFEFYFYQGMNELEELATNYSNLMKGIKIYSCYQNIDLKSDKFKKILQLARKYNLPLMFHTGYSYASQRKYGKDSICQMHNALTLENLAKENSDITFIFSHMSKPFFNELIEVINKYPNVFTDMSGLIDSKFEYDEIPASIEEIKLFINKCGPEKLLFGTDFPVQTHEHSIFMIEKACENFFQAKEKIYYDNAYKILRL